MKKVLCLACFMVLLYTNAWAVATAGPTPVCTDVWNNANEMTCVYTDTTNSVTAGQTEVFQITTLDWHGKISEVSFQSSSTSWSVFLSRIDSLAAATTDTILKWSETSATLGSPELSVPRTYYNGVGMGGDYKYLFFTVAPVTVNTGNWVLTVTFMRY